MTFLSGQKTLCVIVAQKPWGKKRIDDIVRTGAGTLNVDGGRIGIAEGQGGGAKMSSSGQTIGNFQHYEKDGFQASSTGRWPSNFCLIHSPGCERVGMKRVKTAGGPARTSGFRIGGGDGPSVGLAGRKDAPDRYKDPDGYERVDDWKCVEGCAARKLGEQSGERKSSPFNMKHPINPETSWKMVSQAYNPTGGYNDKGTAARFYFQADWEYEKTERTHEMTGGDVGKHEIINADVLDWAKKYKERIERGEAEPFHALLSDPPWHLKGGFMGAYWDRDGLDAISFQKETWQALAEVLHPGAFLFVFAGSRGWHRLACALEDAGLILQPSVFVWGTGVVEVPFCLGWLQGQSFPKASRTHKAPKPKRQRLYRWLGWLGKIGNWLLQRKGLPPRYYLDFVWQGHRYGGQILKDALNPIVVAQKPWTNPRLDCIVETGAGALNVDEGRIGTNDNLDGGAYCGTGKRNTLFGLGNSGHEFIQPQGRWPSNFALTHIPTHSLCPDCKTVYSMQEETCPDCGGELERVEGCKRVGVKKVRGSHPVQPGGGQCETTYMKPRHVPIVPIPRAPFDYTDPDGLESVDAWECAAGCVCAKLGEQSGESKSRASPPNLEPTEADSQIYGFATYPEMHKSGAHYGDEGTAARFFPQCGWEFEQTESGGTNDGNPDQVGETNKEGEFDEGHRPPIPLDGGCAGWKFECAKDCPVAKLDEQAGERGASAPVKGHELSRTGSHGIYGHYERVPGPFHNDSGGASRFYKNADWSHEIAERLAMSDPVRYCPKAAKRERASGLDDFYWCKDKSSPIGFIRISRDEWETLGVEEKQIKKETGKQVSLRAQGNIHPTVKPISLLVWLCKLLSPPKEYAPRRILIPFLGSGSEMAAAIISGCWEETMGVEINQDYCSIAESRAEFWHTQSQEIGSSDPKDILKASNKKPKKEKTGQAKLL